MTLTSGYFRHETHALRGKAARRQELIVELRMDELGLDHYIISRVAKRACGVVDPEIEQKVVEHTERINAIVAELESITRHVPPRPSKYYAPPLDRDTMEA